MPWSFPAPYGLQFGINDSAVIAGTMTVAVGSEFETRGFVWTAVSQSNGATPPVQLFPAGVTNLSVASGESADVDAICSGIAAMTTVLEENLQGAGQ